MTWEHKEREVNGSDIPEVKDYQRLSEWHRCI